MNNIWTMNNLNPIRFLGLIGENLEKQTQVTESLTNIIANTTASNLAMLPDPFSLLKPLINHNKTIAELTRTHDEMQYKTAIDIQYISNYITLRTTDDIDLSKTPLILTAPNAGHNKTIADYNSSRRQSLCERVSDAGFQPYIIDFHSAEDSNTPIGSATITDNLDEVNSAITYVTNKHNKTPFSLGLCQGGWSTAMALSSNPESLQGLGVIAAPIDCHAGPYTNLRKLSDELPVEYFQMIVDKNGGLMRGRDMINAFKSLNETPNAKLGEYFNVLENLDNEKFIERRHAHISWFEYSPNNISGKAYVEICDKLFKNNNFYNGEFEYHGKKLSLEDITCPIISITGGGDEITFREQCDGILDKVSTPNEHKFILHNDTAGHIGMFMGEKVLDNEITNALNIFQKLDRYN